MTRGRVCDDLGLQPHLNMIHGKLHDEQHSNALQVGAQTNGCQDNQSLQTMPFARKLRTLPPIGESGFDRPATRNSVVTPEKNSRKRSPKNMLERPLTQQSNARLSSIPWSFSSTFPGHSLQQPSSTRLLQASLKDLRSHSPNQEILRSEDHIKALLKQSREATSVKTNFDKLCERLVSQHEDKMLARRNGQHRLKESVETSDQANKRSSGSYSMKLSEKIPITCYSSKGNPYKEEPSLNNPGMNRRNTYTILSPDEEVTDFSSEVRQVEVRDERASEKARSEKRPERPKSAKYGRGRPQTGYGTRKGNARESMEI